MRILQQSSRAGKRTAKDKRRIRHRLSPDENSGYCFLVAGRRIEDKTKAVHTARLLFRQEAVQKLRFADGSFGFYCLGCSALSLKEQKKIRDTGYTGGF